MKNNSTEIDLATVDSDGNPPKERIKNVHSAHNIWRRIYDEDDESRRKRAKVQAMVDGEPPYDDKLLMETGQGSRCNLNFDEAGSLLEQALAGYIDMLASVDTLVDVKCTFGEEEERRRYSEVISEEISGILRRWPEFMFNHLQLATQFVTHGVGAAFFKDRKTWQWSIGKFGEFLVPRRSLAHEDKLEVVANIKEFTVSDLYSFIRDEKKAREMGWDVKEVKRTLGSQKYDARYTTIGNNYEEVQERIKNDDIYMTLSADTIKVITMWVKEFDGSVSEYMFREQDAKEFLFKKTRKYESMGEALVLFTFGTGNGFLHGIRGLGYKIYPHIQVSNRLQSQAVDGAMMSSSILLQPDSDAAVENMALMTFGPFALLSPGMQMLKDRPIPNMQQNVMPVIADMRDQIRNKSGQYNPGGIFGERRERTRFEMAAHLDSLSKLSATVLTLWYSSWDKLLRQVVKRISAKDYPTAWEGGEEVKELRQRLLDRGVPVEALYSIDHALTRARRAIGAGSEAERNAILEDLMPVSAQFDAQGQHNFVRDKVASRIGYHAADRYIQSANTPPRPPVDTKVAQLENNQLLNGGEVEVMPNELHLEHLTEHVEALTKLATQIEEQGAPIEQVVRPMMGLYNHAVQHLEMVRPDDTTEDTVNHFRKLLQRLGEYIHNGQRKLQKMQRDAQAQQQEEGGEPRGENPKEAELDFQLAKNFALHQQKLQHLEEMHNVKLRHKALDLQLAQTKKKMKDSRDTRDFLLPNSR